MHFVRKVRQAVGTNPVETSAINERTFSPKNCFITIRKVISEEIGKRELYSFMHQHAHM
jgi:hypothetical protein